MNRIIKHSAWIGAVFSLSFSVGCEEGAGLQIEAGVVEIIDYGFDDAGGEDAGTTDRAVGVDACAPDGSCE